MANETTAEDPTHLDYVVVRTRSAGVHHGRLRRIDGAVVVLANARRLWSWVGANTLNEISLHGLAQGCKNSEAVGEIMLLDAIEVIQTTPKAQETLQISQW